jgi:hypothetical protein
MHAIRRAIPLLLLIIPILPCRGAAQEEDVGRLVRTASGLELRVREQNGIEYSINLPAPSSRAVEDPLPGRAVNVAEAPAAGASASRDAAEPAVQAALERLALRSDDPQVRQAAISALAHAGAPGAWARLARIRERSGDAGLRRSAIRLLAAVPERRRAVAYLVTVAEGSWDAADGYDAPAVAVWTLAEMGDPGANALRDLQRRDAVRSPEGRVALDYVARNGFRAPGEVLSPKS